MRTFLAVLFTAFACAPAVFGQSPGQGPNVTEAARQPLAPMTGAWANPLSGKPIRALVVAPRFAAYDMAGLAKHVECELELVLLPGPGQFEPIAPEPKKVSNHDRLMKRLDDDLDAIVLAGIDTTVLPDDVLAAIVAKVRAGCGLYVSSYSGQVAPPLVELIATATKAEDAGFVVEGSGAGTTTEWEAGTDFLGLWVIDSGRIAAFDFTGTRPRTHALLPSLTKPLELVPEDEATYWSLLVRALRWVARREPELQITRIDRVAPSLPSESEIPPDLPQAFVEQSLQTAGLQIGETYRIVLSKKAERDYGVVARLRTPGRSVPVVMNFGRGVRKGDISYSIQFQVAPGTHILDLWILDKDQIVDWFTQSISAPGWPAITSVTFSKRFLAPNDAVDIELELPAQLEVSLPAQVSAPIPGTMYARAIDAFGRVVSESYVGIAPTARTAKLRLDFVDLLANSVKVEVFALMGPEHQPTALELIYGAYAFTHLPVYHAMQSPAFTVALWTDGAVEFGTQHGYRALQRIGFTAAASAPGNVPGFGISNGGLDPLPVIALGQPGAQSQVACIADNQRQSMELGGMRANVDLQWHSGLQRVFVTSGTDLEALATAPEGSSPCAALFGYHLQSLYPDVAALNAAWEQSFESWDAVIAPDIASQASAGAFAPMLDIATFHENAARPLIDGAFTRIRGIVPEARVGLAIRESDDPALSMWPAMTGMGDGTALPFSRGAVTEAEQFHKPGAIRYAVLSGDTATDAAWAKWAMWYALANCHQGIWIDLDATTPNGEETRTLLTTDLEPTSLATDLASDARAIQRGYDALFSDAEPAVALIGVYRNAASDRIGAVANEELYVATQSRDAAIQLCRSLGYSVRIVSGDTTPNFDGLKVLILPGVALLSDDEVAAIAAFHDTGGMLIADRLPGIYTEHGTRRSALALAERFGVTWPHDRGFAEQAVGGLANATATARPMVDTAVHAGEGPAGNTYRADTHTLLFNYNLAGSPWVTAMSKDDPSLVWRDELCEALVALGATPNVMIDRTNSRSKETELFAHTVSGSVLTTLLRAPGDNSDEERLEIALPADHFHYSLSDGIELARKKPLTLKLAPGKQVCVSSLPYRVKGIVLNAPAEVIFGQRLFFDARIDAEGAVTARHPLHVTFSTIEGQELTYYAKTVRTENGELREYIPLARNEREGNYTLTVRDALTGLQASTPVKVLTGESVGRAKKNFNN